MMIQDGSYVLLFYTSSKKWLTRASSKKKLHTHLGVIDISSIIGLEYGSIVKTTEGKLIHLVEPTIHDFIMKSERATQIIYPKDLGFIVARAGVQSGSMVLEIGTGSGALTTFLASIVKPDGHIHTYDVKPSYIEIAKRNIEKAAMTKYVTTHLFDPIQGYDKVRYDVAIVDLGDPWNVISQVDASLKPSGAFIAICPTMNQLEKSAIELKSNGFIDIDSVELMLRSIEAREGMTRPSMRMIGHTTYLIFARKTGTLIDES